jgi:hypothetical protein
MAPDLFRETLETFRARVPFRPFTVVLNSDDRIEIDHPGALAIRDTFPVFAGQGSVPYLFDHEGVSGIIGDLMGQANSSP